MKSLILSLSKLLILLSGLALAVPAQALTLEQASKLDSFLISTISELDQAKMNLLQMAEGMQSPEYERAMMIYDSANNAINYFDKLNIVTNIYSLMQDSRDQAILKRRAEVYAKQAMKASDFSIGIANRELARLVSPATITEAQKIRDLVQKIRDEIQRTVPGS